MKLFFGLFSVLLFFCATGFSQTKQGILKGMVTDGKTNEAIPGATIQLAKDMSRGVATDVDGKYYFELDTGYHQIVCGYVGLESDTFNVHIFANIVTDKNFRLKSVATLLETVVVSSGKFDQKLEELTVSMEVLMPGLINNKNTTSVETALEQVPGLSVIDNDPQIRGGSGFTFGVGSRVAIVVDGIPLLSGDAGRPEWSYIPVENIEQIEIIKGASSVLYGSSALNGVINVRSAYPRAKPKTVINYSVGHYSSPASPAQSWYNKSLPGFTNLNFLHSQIIKSNFDFTIGGNVNVDQGYIGPAPKGAYVPPDIKLALKIADTIPVFTNDDMLKKRARFNFNMRYRSKNIHGLSYGINGNAMYNKTNMVFAWLNDSLGLYKAYPGALFLQTQRLFNIDPFIKFSVSNGISHSLIMRLFNSDNQISNNLSNSGTMLYGEYQLQRRFSNIDLNFTGGIVGNRSTSHASLYASSGTPNNKISNASGYLQLDKKLWRVLNLSGGFRYEYFKMNTQQSVVAPIFRAGASLQVIKGTYVRTSYGQGFRYPTITERYIATKAGIFGVFPNPDLKPETSNSFEIGLKQGFKIGSFAGYLDVAGFYQKYHNTIEYLFGVWDPDVSLIGFKFLNTGDSRVRGIDVSLAGSTIDETKKIGVTALLGYTYIEPVSLTPDSVYARDKSLGGFGQNLSYKSSSMDTTNNILKYRFKHMVKGDIEFKIYKLGFGFSYRGYSKMNNIDKAFADVELLTSDSPYFDQIKAVNYWKTHTWIQIFDARISFNIDKKQKLSLVCNNFFNTAYSLRPLKIESPRATSLQYVLTF